MKMVKKEKNRSHRFKQHLKLNSKLSNTETELKKSVAYKKSVYKENEVRLQKPIKFILKGKSLFWNFSSCLKMKNHLGRVSPSHFLQNVLIETLNVCFKFLMLHFAIS